MLIGVQTRLNLIEEVAINGNAANGAGRAGRVGFRHPLFLLGVTMNQCQPTRLVPTARRSASSCSAIAALRDAPSPCAHRPRKKIAHGYGSTSSCLANFRINYPSLAPARAPDFFLRTSNRASNANRSGPA